MIITITGKPGSGKSTVGKEVAKALGYRFFSAGDLRGEIAMRRGLTIDELNEIGKKEAWTDKECDDLLKKMGKEEDNIVFDSRLAWHFIPKSFKVFLDVDLNVAAKRIFKDQRVDEAKAGSEKEMHDRIMARMNNDSERYGKWYKLDIFNLKQYDLVIDTSKMTPREIVKSIVGAVKSKRHL
ncbi:hypothetical protein C4580_05150 [Candidatus Woesearchaeota archaeon]|nr:MAG: hypothetical protein C4580_05150 [Candidatus Woesearchaeota archaeon]